MENEKILTLSFALHQVVFLLNFFLFFREVAVHELRFQENFSTKLAIKEIVT